MPQNNIGAYGPWFAGLLDRQPNTLSPSRGGRFKTAAAWRKAARKQLTEWLAPPPMPKTPNPRVEARGVFEGVAFEKLSWALPWGPRTEGVFLKPANAPANEKLPGVLALHDHGGRKYFGWRKIAIIDEKPHPLMVEHRAQCYGNLAWANEVAKRGYAVLCHDTFPFGSRGVKIGECIDRVQRGQKDVSASETSEEIHAYHEWAGWHESLMAKSLFCAGTTWPGVYLTEDQVALSILAARRGVDASRLGCGGLSGGGMRTVFLAGLDERIASCFCAGFFTTWRDFLLNKAHTHTWMAYVPLAPREIDFSEILALRAPKPALVLNTTEDPLYTLSEVKRAGRIAAAAYKFAKAPKAFKLSHYPGGHQFDAAMQDEAFAWLDRDLRK